MKLHSMESCATVAIVLLAIEGSALAEVPIGEAPESLETEALTPLGTACKLACSVAYASGCGAVSLACAGATTMTIGGFALPCKAAIIAACWVGAPSGITLCHATCPP